MNTATELAMDLADVKLRIRQLTAPFSGKHTPFDDGIRRAIHGLNKAIIESVEAVHYEKGTVQPKVRRSSRT